MTIDWSLLHDLWPKMSEEEQLRMPSQLNKTQKIWQIGIWQNMCKHYSSINKAHLYSISHPKGHSHQGLLLWSHYQSSEIRNQIERCGLLSATVLLNSDDARPHAAHVASTRMKDTHLRCLILTTWLNSLLMTMILLGHSWKFLVDSVSKLIQKYNSWCMSGYARSQRNFFIRNTGISKVLGPHNTMWTMLKNNRAVSSMSPQNQLVKTLQVFHLTCLCV